MLTLGVALGVAVGVLMLSVVIAYMRRSGDASIDLIDFHFFIIPLYNFSLSVFKRYIVLRISMMLRSLALKMRILKLQSYRGKLNFK